TGVLTDEVVSVNGTATFDTRDVDTAKTITVTDFVLTGENAANYRLTTTSANTTGDIIVRDIVVFAENSTKIFGESDPMFTYTHTPKLITGDAFAGALSRQPGENAGQYAITQRDQSAWTNYAITFVPASFVITSGSIPGITFPDGSFIYDGTPRPLSIQ